MSWVNTITDVAEIVVKILYLLPQGVRREDKATPKHWTGPLKWNLEKNDVGSIQEVNVVNESDHTVCLVYSDKEPPGETDYKIDSEFVELTKSQSSNQIMQIEDWAGGQLSISPAEKPNSNNRQFTFAAAAFTLGVSVDLETIKFSIEKERKDNEERYKFLFTSTPSGSFKMIARCTDHQNRSVQAEAEIEGGKNVKDGEPFYLPKGIDLSGGILELSGEIEVSQKTYESILRASEEQRAERINAKMGRNSA